MPVQPSVTCETCGEVFTRQPGSKQPHAAFKARRFCSSECKRAHTRPLIERLMEGVVFGVDGCWDWTGAVRSGYGAIGVGRRSDGIITTHVAMYELRVGPIPDGLVLDHLCRNRRCCNPDHLEPVTQKVNAQRGARAKLTDADVAHIRSAWDGGQTQASLAREFGLHSATVSRIVNGHRWPEASKPFLRSRTAIPA